MSDQIGELIQEDWKAKIETLESEIHRYEDIIDRLELGSDSDVIRLLQQLHGSKHNHNHNASNGTSVGDSRHERDDKGS